MRLSSPRPLNEWLLQLPSVSRGCSLSAGKPGLRNKFLTGCLDCGVLCVHRLIPACLRQKIRDDALERVGRNSRTVIRDGYDQGA